MEKFKKITGKAVIEYGTSENDFFIHDDACLICGSLGVNKNKIDEMLQRINGYEAQQQEIDSLKQQNNHWQETCADLHISYGDKIDKLVQDKDEQAGRIMQMDTVLKQAKEVLELLHPKMNPEEPCFVYEVWKAIDALLGGKEDAI